MTAIIYFGEMSVVSILAIVLLAISQLRMSSGAALFAGRTLLRIAADMTGERHHATARSHADMSFADAGLPGEFVEYGLLQALVCHFDTPAVVGSGWGWRRSVNEVSS
jgi:hypothetical protein